jgi:hypothetical protein
MPFGAVSFWAVVPGPGDVALTSGVADHLHLMKDSFL